MLRVLPCLAHDDFDDLDHIAQSSRGLCAVFQAVGLLVSWESGRSRRQGSSGLL